jgi:hypothetical protein
MRAKAVELIRVMSVATMGGARALISDGDASFVALD